jgi:hypothetical protein
MVDCRPLGHHHSLLGHHSTVSQEGGPACSACCCCCCYYAPCTSQGIGWSSNTKLRTPVCCRSGTVTPASSYSCNGTPPAAAAVVVVVMVGATALRQVPVCCRQHLHQQSGAPTAALTSVCTTHAWSRQPQLLQPPQAQHPPPDVLPQRWSPRPLPCHQSR